MYSDERDGATPRPTLLPAEGYPNAEQPLREWFRKTHGREAMDVELGALMSAMNARDSVRDGITPEADKLGWTVGKTTVR